MTEQKQESNLIQAESKLQYYDFKSTWKEQFVQHLNDKNVLTIRRLICEEILVDLLDNVFVDDYYRWKPEFIEKLKISSHEEQIKLIDSHTWGKFSPIMMNGDELDKEDYKVYWPLVSKDEYDSPESVGHYLWWHNCEAVAIFVFVLLKSVWPKKEWQIIIATNHTFVVEKNKENVIYDINWYLTGLPTDNIKFSCYLCKKEKSDICKRDKILCGVQTFDNPLMILQGIFKQKSVEMINKLITFCDSL
jgi:hypothetical protein